ncbi:hypothetical protein GGR57DRAFT_508047 [Xylariaceae sp. FL1272]|nr:hypothetical protein GGR57DRAFT_508047 [Xylariaceae sp. FL1272]
MLRRVYGQKNIDLRDWYDFCRSCPWDQFCHVLDWGYDYELGRKQDLFSLDLPKSLNSLYLPELQEQEFLQAKTPHFAPKQRIDLFKKSTKKYFDVLPPEIRELILTFLPSKDVLHLRSTVRAISCLELSSDFWKSRFCTPMELQHVFEPWDVKKGSVLDWRGLYSYAKRFHCGTNRSSAALVERSRIWRNAVLLQQVIDEAGSLTCHGAAGDFESEAHSAAGGYICGPTYSFNDGCRALKARRISAIRTVKHIYVSLVHLPDGQYITGLRFVESSQKELTIGYIRTRTELPVRWSDGIARQKRLRGFELAVSLKGIRGICIHDESGQVSKWVGNCKGFARKLLLCEGQSKVQMNCQFDFMKMVSASIYASVNNIREAPSKCLRTSSIWFPKIPPENAKFYNVFVEAQLRPDNALHVNMFGGDCGEKLKHITEVIIWIREGFLLHGIEVKYDEMESTFLGLCGPYNDPPHPVYKDERFSVSIDGPGGERIQRIQIRTDTWDGTDMALKACINYTVARVY